MPTRPRAKVGRHLVTGLAAVALFVAMAAVFLQADFAPLVESIGFPEGSVTASIGYALFDITGEMGGIPSDGFLAAFLIIAIVLDAALDGSLMLAARDEGGDK